jgi:hypothetical protein
MKLLRYADDLLMFGGCAAIVFGVALWSVPAAFIIGGLLMIGLAFIIGKVKLITEKDGENDH